jgi:lipopolysaccharide/colanic/teichoic acid biosynthesis glycosyltransferase
LIDYVLSASILLIIWPLLLIIAVAIKFSSPGPVFYAQERCGLYGRRFKMYKFRTMFPGADNMISDVAALNEMDGPVFKMKNDPRIIPGLGSFLRRKSLDELPQLFNVMRGEMSMVGPRPPLPEEVRLYKTWQMRRLFMKPGITCIWQIQPNRNEIPFERWMELDLEYIDHWSILLDLKLLIKTIPAVFQEWGR